VGITILRKRQANGQDPVRIEARVYGLDLGEALQQNSGTRQEDQRERHFDNHESGA
jgi:hypothetical protein